MSNQSNSVGDRGPCVTSLTIEQRAELETLVQYARTRHPSTSCTDYAPRGFSGHWRDWHRGHGCDKDDARPRTPLGDAEIRQLTAAAFTVDLHTSSLVASALAEVDALTAERDAALTSLRRWKAAALLTRAIQDAYPHARVRADPPLSDTGSHHIDVVLRGRFVVVVLQDIDNIAVSTSDGNHETTIGCRNSSASSFALVAVSQLLEAR